MMTSTPFFIAEVSSNHHRDLDRCMAFIKASAEIGCDAVKFQLFKIEQLFAPEVLAKSEKHRERRNWELPSSFFPELKQCCYDHCIQFACTPFYLDAVNELAPYVDFYKIASYELLWDDLLIACAKTNKPVVISAGMANLDEIDHAIATLKDASCQHLTLLHCVSAYPTPMAECNLAVLDTFRQRYDVKVGWSDHSVEPAVIRRAVNRWQADCIEFHIDLDEQGAEYSAGHCWLPQQMRSVIRECRDAAVIDGRPDKVLAPSEAPDRDWRADPSDGLRPMKPIRDSFGSNE